MPESDPTSRANVIRALTDLADQAERAGATMFSKGIANRVRTLRDQAGMAVERPAVRESLYAVLHLVWDLNQWRQRARRTAPQARASASGTPASGTPASDALAGLDAALLRVLTAVQRTTAVPYARQLDDLQRCPYQPSRMHGVWFAGGCIAICGLVIGLFGGLQSTGIIPLGFGAAVIGLLMYLVPGWLAHWQAQHWQRLREHGSLRLGMVWSFQPDGYDLVQVEMAYVHQGRPYFTPGAALGHWETWLRPGALLPIRIDPDAPRSWIVDPSAELPLEQREALEDAVTVAQDWWEWERRVTDDVHRRHPVD